MPERRRAVPFSIANQSGRQTLRLAGTITVRDAQKLASELREGLEEGIQVEVDTEKLEDIDTCILQLLYALRETIPALSFGHPSEVFVGALERCGLRRELLGGREGL
jgi:ABC-type transporter Mla MlaB component